MQRTETCATTVRDVWGRCGSGKPNIRRRCPLGAVVGRCSSRSNANPLNRSPTLSTSAKHLHKIRISMSSSIKGVQQCCEHTSLTTKIALCNGRLVEDDLFCSDLTRNFPHQATTVVRWRRVYTQKTLVDFFATGSSQLSSILMQSLGFNILKMHDILQLIFC